MYVPSHLTQDPSNVIATVGGFFAAGGIMMWPILGCSIMVLGLVIERHLSMRRGRVLPRAVVDAVEQVCQGRAAVIAEQIAESTAPAARVLTAGLRRRGLPLADIERGMADQINREGALLRGNVRGIGLMAAVAPLCGLLGTVLGIARAFAAVEKTGLDRAETLAAGIGVALYTTIFGLVVAIPATLLSAQLQAKVRSRMLALDSALAPAVEALAATRPPLPNPPLPNPERPDPDQPPARPEAAPGQEASHAA